MRIMIELFTDGAAFDLAPEVETAQILRELADRIEARGIPRGSMRLRDSNGNTVGGVEVTEA